MFGFIQKLGGGPTVQIVHYGEGLVHFKHSKKLAVGEQFQMQGRLPTGEKVPLNVQVVQQRGDGVYLGRPVEPLDGVKVLEKTFLPNANASKEQMFYKLDDEASTSHMRTYAVRSPVFEKFKGVTAELSTGAAKVVLQGPLQDGQQLELELDLVDDHPPIKIKAHVEWCQQRDKKAFVVSLIFDEISEEDRAAMKEHLSGLKHNPALHRDE